MLKIFIPSAFKLTNIFPAEAASSSRAVGVQVSISKVTLLVEPQSTLVIIHYLLPVGTFSSLILKPLHFRYKTVAFPLLLWDNPDRVGVTEEAEKLTLVACQRS